MESVIVGIIIIIIGSTTVKGTDRAVTARPNQILVVGLAIVELLCETFPLECIIKVTLIKDASVNVHTTTQEDTITGLSSSSTTIIAPITCFSC